MFRRRGTRVGTCTIGICLLLSCAVLVRNFFGLFMLLLMGIILLLCGWKASDFWVSELYATLAATTCLNAITSIRVLYSPGSATVGGVVSTTDASAMQNATLIPYWVWATIWLLLASICTIIGVIVVLEPPPDTTRFEQQTSQDHNVEEQRVQSLMETELS